MTPKVPKNLPNSPGTATDDRSQRVQGPPNKPGQHERDDDRMTKSGRHRLTKEAYEAGRRIGEPKSPSSHDDATHRAEDKRSEKPKTR
jgi:hypothetical protein